MNIVETTDESFAQDPSPWKRRRVTYHRIESQQHQDLDDNYDDDDVISLHSSQSLHEPNIRHPKLSNVILEPSHSIGEQTQNQSHSDPTYWNLLRYNRPYRLFILCHLFTLAGEWFTYVASISLIERKQSPENPNVRTETGLLLLVWLMPNMLLSAVGGALADALDRRKVIIYIDLVSAFFTSGYFVAYYYNSIALIYLVTFFRQSAAAIYQPCRLALVPMMVQEDEFLKKATTLSGFIWAIMATCGSAMGGLTVALLGIHFCFIIDMTAYLTSAYIMYTIGGTWIAQQHNNEDEEEDEEEKYDDDQPIDESSRPETKASFDENKMSLQLESPSWGHILTRFSNMSMDGLAYLRNNFFGPLVFLKFSAAVIYGSLTVIQVSVSQRYSKSFSEPNQDKDQSNSSALLGILLACTGIGSFLGTALTDRFADVNHAPSLQLGCIWSFLCMAFAYLIMGTFISFPMVCVCSSVIYVALTIIWIQSDLIFQLYASSYMLGRVSAVDYALATLSEGLSSFLSGVLEDRFYLSIEDTCKMMSLLSFIVYSLWFIFHCRGGGAASSSSSSIGMDKVFKSETESSRSKDELELVSQLGHFISD